MSNIEVKLKLGAFAIILNEENEVLLSHRRDMDLWNLPGGGIEDSETPWDAVIREVKEETCLNVRISKLQGIYSNPKMNKTVFSFICEIISGDISTTNEADIHRFFNIDEVNFTSNSC